MIINLIVTTKLLGSMLCPNIDIQVPSSMAWTEIDIHHLEIAQRRCPTLFPRSPCLVKFRKVEELTYWAICGAAINTKGE